jgi:small multidrug resistance family-3 protein
MTVLRSILLFAAAAIAEIGGAWLVWQGVREHRGSLWVGAGIICLGLYGFVATQQPEANFGRILAAYGGVFVAGTLAWGMVVDGFRPDRFDSFGSGGLPHRSGTDYVRTAWLSKTAFDKARLQEPPFFVR